MYSIRTAENQGFPFLFQSDGFPLNAVKDVRTNLALKVCQFLSTEQDTDLETTTAVVKCYKKETSIIKHVVIYSLIFFMFHLDKGSSHGDEPSDVRKIFRHEDVK